jgi:hypothetical protein
MRRGLALGLILAALCATRASYADLRATIDLPWLVRQSESWLDQAMHPAAPRNAALARDVADRHQPVVPRGTAIARDFDGSLPIPGSNVLVTDRVRVSRSTRMLFGRARVDWLGIVPYVQAGVGLWRPDRDAIFIAHQDYAAQVGAGFEASIARRGQLGLECNHTWLYREERDDTKVPHLRVLSVFGVLRAEF